MCVKFRFTLCSLNEILTSYSLVNHVHIIISFSSFRVSLLMFFFFSVISYTIEHFELRRVYLNEYIRNLWWYRWYGSYCCRSKINIATHILMWMKYIYVYRWGEVRKRRQLKYIIPVFIVQWKNDWICWMIFWVGSSNSRKFLFIRYNVP